MHRLYQSLGAIAIILVLSGCQGVAPYDQQGQNLYGARLHKTMADQTLMGGINNGPGSWAMYIAQNGETLFQLPSGRIYEMNWRMAGDRFCLADDNSDEKPLCLQIRHRAPHAAFIGGHSASQPPMQFVDEDGRKLLYVMKRQPCDIYDLSNKLERQKFLIDRLIKTLQEIEEREKESPSDTPEGN